jgi:histidyl-tRNA synthetase
LWRVLGLTNVSLELNSLGTREEQAIYRERSRDYLHEHRDALDEDSRRRLSTNPLRVLDSKNPQLQALIAAAPTPRTPRRRSRAHFDEVPSGTCCERAASRYRTNPRLVRGLDYYTRTVFEWVSGDLGCAERDLRRRTLRPTVRGDRRGAGCGGRIAAGPRSPSSSATTRRHRAP